MSFPKIFVHIGYPKTGSSSLQDFFYRNRQKLSKVGILYPETGLQWHGHHALAGLFQHEHDQLYWLMTNRKFDYQAELRKEIFEKKPKTVVFSSEAFAFTQKIAGLKKFFSEISSELKLLFFFRRQDYWIESAYTQLYKAGLLSFSFNKFLNNSDGNGYNDILKLADYNDFLKLWLNFFDISNFNICIIDPLFGYKNVLQFIFETFNLEEYGFKFEDNFKNRKLAFDALQLCNLIHKKTERKLHGKMIEDFEEYSKLNPERCNYTFFTEYDRERYITKFNASNQEIAEKYFLRNLLFSPYEVTDLEFIDDQIGKIDIAEPLSYIFKKYGLYDL